MNKTDDLPAVTQHMNLLFDFYGSLLTQKQSDCFTMRYIDDYSLAEIGQELNISPQAVVDFIKRATTSLTHYEEHLQLVRKHQQRQPLAKEIQAMLDNLSDAPNQVALVEKISNTIGDLIQI